MGRELGDADVGYVGLCHCREKGVLAIAATGSSGHWMARGGEGGTAVQGQDVDAHEPSGSLLLKHESMMRRFSSSNISALDFWGITPPFPLRSMIPGRLKAGWGRQYSYSAAWHRASSLPARGGLGGRAGVDGGRWSIQVFEGYIAVGGFECGRGASRLGCWREDGLDVCDRGIVFSRLSLKLAASVRLCCRILASVLLPAGLTAIAGE